ncbi:PucR family transcriptional regulator [Pelosinus sp. sgz500959]|uniref:PucR family transcriptional regulator n=1 Tax=Pelosinus sp. sgz500959 TaxID=3242472 RepID=UPI00366F67E4
MGITVQAALAIDVMNQTKIIAGKTGLDREIKWVSVMELLDEVSSLQEGELLITTAFDLTDSPNLLDELIPYLAKRNLAGLAIQTGYYLDIIPPTIIQKCNEYNFPLLELPKHIVFSELTKAIAKQIINSQMEMLEYARLIHDRLTLVILQNEGLPQVAKVLSELIKAPVRILDTYFNLLTYSGLDKSSCYVDSEKIQMEYQSLKKRKLLTYAINSILSLKNTPSDIPYQFLQPLMVGNDIYGYISVLTDEKVLEDMKKIAISSAATISTLEILKEKAIWEAEERVKGDFIDDLLENNIKTEKILHRRANYLGFDLAKKFIIFSVSIDNLNDIILNHSEEHLQEIKQNLFSLIRFFLQSYQKQALLKYKSNKLIILLQVNTATGKAEISKIAHSLQAIIRGEMQITASIGIGQIYNKLSDIPKSSQEAEHALSIGYRLQKKDCILYYEDLGAYNLFGNNVNEKELYNYYLQTVSPIIDYDLNHKSELVTTFEAFLECNSRIKETSQKLYVHRHTLKYRLNRIYEITGFDPENSQDQFKLQLGLIVARLLSRV